MLHSIIIISTSGIVLFHKDFINGQPKVERGGGGGGRGGSRPLIDRSSALSQPVRLSV
jgi:hypothetical protein